MSEKRAKEQRRLQAIEGGGNGQQSTGPRCPNCFANGVPEAELQPIVVLQGLGLAACLGCGCVWMPEEVRRQHLMRLKAQQSGILTRPALVGLDGRTII